MRRRGAGALPVVLLDVDGPLTLGFVDAVRKFLHGIGRTELPPLHHWDMREWGLTGPLRESIDNIMRAPGVAAAFNPREGAREFVRELQEFADVRFVTAPYDGAPTWAHDREEWLCKHFGASPDQIISCRDKSLVRGGAILDDKPDTVRAWQRCNPLGLGVLWREEYNASEEANLSASNYEEVLALLTRLS